MAREVLKQYPASLKILLRSYQSSEQLDRYRFCESANEVVATSPASTIVPKIATSRFTLSLPSPPQGPTLPCAPVGPVALISRFSVAITAAGAPAGTAMPVQPLTSYPVSV